ncbi:hypothetical protein [Burkholderia sp. Bp8998]|uniref:hypothetical protein n=1 Tax=Burkholderia sp. Bp8998 TaxID=2184557 RepID=UPI00163A4099|nr:hypothetical protein [Burkholderia sp. Bp8998]
MKRFLKFSIRRDAAAFRANDLEVRRKIHVACRRGERNHPAIHVHVFVEQIVRTASSLLG